MQRYTSARTCRRQFPALHRALLQAGTWKGGDTNADLGGGKFEDATVRLAGEGVENIVWDPYNRPWAHNAKVLRRIHRGTTTATVSNVLNVIAEPKEREKVIRLATHAGRAFFYVYEGNRTGVGCATRDGWQENRKLATYLPEIQPYFWHVQPKTIAGVKVIEAF